ncbi:MAG: hypothetical protein JW719_13685 [Pirellulales bacterium]|nr:hypothetical protein [Pirellulales bacterium]
MARLHSLSTTHHAPSFLHAPRGQQSRRLARAVCLGASVLCVFLAVGDAFAQYYLNVQPVDWTKYSGLTGVQLGDTLGQNINTILQNESRYLYNWVDANYEHNTFKYFNEIEGYYGGSLDGSGVRPLAHFAWGNAVMLRTGTYDPVVSGLPASDALRRTEWALRGVAMTHASNRPDGSGWGQGTGYGEWQGAYWASRGGQAAWMLWDSLSVETKTAVANMIKWEADAFIDFTVPYWRNPDGSTNTPGNTRAEENAWDSRILTMAQAMMPNDPNIDLWRLKSSELMVASYSRESDIYNTTLVDGIPVNEWINGYNTFDDGVLVNHGIVHPGYMAVHTLTYDTLVDASLAGQYIPESAFFNNQVNWDSMTQLNFVAGTDPYATGHPLLPPGGTVFHKNPDGSLDPAPYFPNGDDWSADPTTDVNYVLHLMYGELRGLDAGEEVDSMDWINCEIDALRDLQLRSGHDGNIYQDGDWASDRDGNEIDTYREISEAWMIYWLNQHNQVSPTADHWGALPTLLPGDTNYDFEVDAADATVLADFWGRTGLGGGFTVGDFNSDGTVNALDASILAANWGSHVEESSAKVPEPSSAVLLAVLALIALLPRQAR